ncbi:uncharacterized protein NECHADRAFT_75761 [Fusarium vanettenii 77-13-4]|uniref:Uncharacterized protein n=1 Tax=Fusarium vanettenii (strain ATCC MYA-4622 / CBS 123669 / FGSC 9596 / NRRL 45880 / 77-13-4) TaxID=660122 RepID=C7YJQ5_FUSV7|nr:uncharacterized protein NECHADRAFT_75761 [Fusarium vanettenii 77-13-4]EEU49017.1 hypothetical protein NECHADRAFT_75761 [Fusarium vanettenii 77-13-4]
MAEGGDLAIYNANKSIIQNLLEHSGIPESDHKLWIGIYRIGANQDESRPAIVVSCLDSKVRKQAKGSIKNCSLLRPGGAFAHFAVLGKATPPELPCEPQLTMAGNAQAHRLASTISSSARQSEELTNQGPGGDIRENIKHPVVLQLFGSHTGDSYLCRPIQARRGLQRQSATAGPLLFLDGTSYQLTVEHVVNFSRHKSEPTWEHTNDDWDDDDEDHADDDARGRGDVEDIVPSDFGTVRTMSEGSVSSEEVEIDLSGSSSSSSAQETEGNTSWSPMVPASSPLPQSSSEPRTVSNIIVNDSSSSPQTEPISSPPRCYTSAKMDYLLFPIHVNPGPEACTAGGAEMVQLSDVFDVHGQTKARPIIITTASLGYVQGIVFPASMLLQKPGSRNFQTLFCIESSFPMPKGTSGSAVFDSQTGLLAGYLVLGCPGKHTCYMVPMCDVLAELNMFSSSIVRCQVQLNMSAIAKVDLEKSALTRFSFCAGGFNRSVPLSSVLPRQEAVRRNNRPFLGKLLEHVPVIFPKPTGHVEEDLKTKKSPRNPPKFKTLQSWISPTIATLEWVSEPADEWKTRFGQTTKLIGSVENRPYIDVIREMGIEVSPELWTFFQPKIPSARWERRISQIERFCEGASFALDGSGPRDAENPTFEDDQGPRAWVSDRNCVTEGSSYPKPNYPRVLGYRGLYHALQRKRLQNNACDDTTGHPRRIYIEDPDGSSVVALTKTTPASQTEGFCDLFANYITPTPEPKFSLRASDWSGGCFIISFNIPFFEIGSEHQRNIRTTSHDKTKRPLRACHSLSFLNLNSQRSKLSSNEVFNLPHPLFLHEAVCSFMVTGKSDRYWTAAFLDGDSCSKEPRLSQEEELDPIVLKAETNCSDTTASPRAYALAALAVSLDVVVEHHQNIQDLFKASLTLLIAEMEQKYSNDISTEKLREWIENFPRILDRITHSNSYLLAKLDHFLSEDVIFGSDALPHGALWRSLRNDREALMSLLRIKQHRNELRDVQNELKQLIPKANEVRRLQKWKIEGEQHVITRQVYRVAVALYSAWPTMADLPPWHVYHPPAWHEYLPSAWLVHVISMAMMVILGAYLWQNR